MRAHPAAGFTQHGGGSVLGNAVPMGHEWLTRLSAVELLGGDRVLEPDLHDPRNTWTDGRGKAKNLALDAAAQREAGRIRAQTTSENVYAATYKPVWDAIIGERWVDIGGYNFAKEKAALHLNCLDLVAQQPAAIQQDHYMRRYDDVGGQGGINAAERSKAAFIEYFVNAATAKSGPMEVWDGGGYASLVTVDRNYFLFGRALHLFEDSFSPDHTVRVTDDRFEKVRQVKSYLCAFGSEQHAHSSGIPGYEEGDVIWKPGSKWNGTDWSTYRPSNMKDVALVATEATKDAWAAFIRSMASSNREAIARREATALADRWLGLNNLDESRTWYQNALHRNRTYVASTSRTDDGGNGRSQMACMTSDLKTQLSQAAFVKNLDDGQKSCLYNTVPVSGTGDNYDAALHLAFNWEWRSSTSMVDVPKDWKITDPVPLPRVKIISRDTHKYMSRGSNDWIYCDGDITQSVLEFDIVGALDNATLRLANTTGEYLNQSDGSYGQVGVYGSSNRGQYELLRQLDGSYAIKNKYWDKYMYLANYKPYVHGNANPANQDARWVIEGLPQPYPADGVYQLVSVRGPVVYARTRGGRIETESRSVADNDPKARFTVKRHPSSGYQFEWGDGSPSSTFIRSDAADGTSSLSVKGQNANTLPEVFFLEEQRTGYYRIRNSDGRIWRTLPNGSVEVSMEMPFFSPEDCNRIGPPMQNGRKELPPNFDDRCEDPTLFQLRRLNWP